MPRNWKQTSAIVLLLALVAALAYFGWNLVTWADVATSVASAVISALFIGLLAVLGLPGFVKRLRKEDQLHGVALMRSAGVEIRNRGGRRLDDQALKDWLEEASKWEADAAAVVGRFSRVEGERLRTLDRTKDSGHRGLPPEHDRLMRNLNAALERMDVLLERHSPAQF